MLVTLLMLLAAPDDAKSLMTNAAGKLSVACADRCGEPAARSPFRLDPVAGETTTSKDRALREDGSYCSVIGARRCTRKPRTLFRTDFTD